jgi:hypothetical protein
MKCIKLLTFKKDLPRASTFTGMVTAVLLDFSKPGSRPLHPCLANTPFQLPGHEKIGP